MVPMPKTCLCKQVKSKKLLKIIMPELQGLVP